MYQDDTFDVLWVAGHGEYDHFSPEQAHLPLAGDQRAAIVDLESPPERAERRLLVLNACDSASFLVHGGLADVGLTAAAAQPAQAVISHLWPVDSMITAPVFAALLARQLGDHDGFFAAYPATILSMISRDAALMSAAAVALGPTHPRVVDGDLSESWTPYEWGSADFYE